MPAEPQKLNSMKWMHILYTALMFIKGSHYNDVIMSTLASQITSLTIIYSTAYSGADQR